MNKTNDPPLSAAEELLLQGFFDLMKDYDGSDKRFYKICDFLEGASIAAKALVELKAKAG